MNIGIIGTGTWGIALGRMLSNSGNNVTMWSSSGEHAKLLSSGRKHHNLPGMVIPSEIVFTNDITKCCFDSDIIIIAVPSSYFRQTVCLASPYIDDGQIIVSVAKGIEKDTLMFMTDIIEDVIDKDVRTVALSGPTHAEEVAIDLPSAIVSASKDKEAAMLVQEVCMNTCMRVYTNSDILGVELCGALKNIIALAAGISSGLSYGDNAKAAIVTRGMAEITRLGLKLGANKDTFMGLAGIGDLIVTCTSSHSRNNRAGELIGKGVKPELAMQQIGMVVEGANALPAAMELSKKYNVELPICSAVNEIIYNGADPSAVVAKLMGRPKKGE